MNKQINNAHIDDYIDNHIGQFKHKNMFTSGYFIVMKVLNRHQTPLVSIFLNYIFYEVEIQFGRMCRLLYTFVNHCGVIMASCSLLYNGTNPYKRSNIVLIASNFKTNFPLILFRIHKFVSKLKINYIYFF